MKEKVVIIGGGFGGITAAKYINNKFDIIIIDKNNYHLFQPLLYQVATASLSPADIASPIRSIFKERNLKTIMGEVIAIDRENREVVLDYGEKIKFDYLIVAPGSRHSYFGKDQWEQFAPGIKNLNDALIIREKILYSFELAERSGNILEAKKYLTFVIVGGGPTGVELAGAIAEIAKRIIAKDYRSIDINNIKIYLVEALPRILNMYPDNLSKIAQKDLEKMGVEVLLNTMVTDVNESGVRIGEKFIESKNKIWAAGNVAAPVLKTLDTQLDKAGRVLVNPDLSIQEDSNIFVIGDSAALKDEEGNLLPGIAPVALQQGKYVGKIISKKVKTKSRKIFKYFDKGMMATIGSAKAIALIKGFKLSGFIAWVAWSLIHVMYLIGFRNRFRVMAEWAWYYLTYRHGIRLITHKKEHYSS
ncbi:MAG: NAD(P)/FAD-dependent oxidoreductase [Syntrophothermus sp.]